MTYTFWHCGVQIGETGFEKTHGRQKFGVFRPTAYGLELFPRLSGFLSAASKLKDEMVARGLNPDADVSRVDGVFDATEGGREMVALGRTLIDVELRDPAGKRLEFSCVAFSDLVELKRLCRKLDVGHDIPPDDEIPPDGPRYLVSVTLGKSPVPFPRFGMTSQDN